MLRPNVPSVLLKIFSIVGEGTGGRLIAFRFRVIFLLDVIVKHLRSFTRIPEMANGRYGIREGPRRSF
jgi:hypothetical protein